MTKYEQGWKNKTSVEKILIDINTQKEKEALQSYPARKYALTSIQLRKKSEEKEEQLKTLPQRNDFQLENKTKKRYLPIPPQLKPKIINSKGDVLHNFHQEEVSLKLSSLTLDPPITIEGLNVQLISNKSLSDYPKKEGIDDNKTTSNHKRNSFVYSTAIVSKDIALNQTICTSLIGLDNIGNTCYLNTCLQNLIHCEPLMKRLIESTDLMKAIPKGNITKAFYNLCLSIIKCRAKSFPPRDFKVVFSRSHIEFNGCSQHDSLECCRKLINDISTELNLVKVKPKYREIETKNKSKEEIFDDYSQYFFERENSIIVDTFYGLTENIFICTCGFESFSYQRFLDLPIILPERGNLSGSIPLIQLLKEFFKEDTIKWEAKCEKCFQKTVHIKKSMLASLPEVLIISFQRYNSHTKKKNSISISFPSQIDLSMLVDKECYSSENTTYTLTGLSNHRGSMTFGHYYAHQIIEGCWYEFNDTFVTKSKIVHESTGAYCLFFQKKI